MRHAVLAQAAGCLMSVRPVCTGKVKKELDADDSHLNLDETAKLLQDLHEAQAERGGSRPSSNLSSLSNTSPSDRDQHHLGKVAPVPSICLTVRVLGGIWVKGRSAGSPGTSEPMRAACPGSRTPRALLPLQDAPCPLGFRVTSPSSGRCTGVKCLSGIYSVLGIVGLVCKVLAFPVSGAASQGPWTGQNEAPDADRHVEFTFGDVCFFLLFPFLVLKQGVEKCFVLPGP